jgi:hypothetical protein
MQSCQMKKSTRSNPVGPLHYAANNVRRLKTPKTKLTKSFNYQAEHEQHIARRTGAGAVTGQP